MQITIDTLPHSKDIVSSAVHNSYTIWPKVCAPQPSHPYLSEDHSRFSLLYCNYQLFSFGRISKHVGLWLCGFVIIRIQADSVYTVILEQICGSI